MKQYLYFREVTTIENDDDSSSSCLIPVDSLIGMYPIGDADGASSTDEDSMVIRFDPITVESLKVNTHWIPEATAKGPKNVAYSRHIKHENGKVELTITDNKFREVIETISIAISSGKHFIVVADNVKQEFISPYIENCVNIEIAYDTGIDDTDLAHSKFTTS